MDGFSSLLERYKNAQRQKFPSESKNLLVWPYENTQPQVPLPMGNSDWIPAAEFPNDGNKPFKANLLLFWWTLSTLTLGGTLPMIREDKIVPQLIEFAWKRVHTSTDLCPAVLTTNFAPV